MKEPSTQNPRIHWSFRQQLLLCFVVFLIDILLAHLFQTGVFHNLSWLVWGLLFLVNPVWPEGWIPISPSHQNKGLRIAGAILILIGLTARFGI